MQNPHLTALETKHQTLEQRIAAEQARPLPDQGAIAELKRRKLRVKEEITLR